MKRVVLRVVFGVALCLTVVGCEEEPDIQNPTLPESLHGVIVLNQGGNGTNDASLSYYNPESDSIYSVNLGDPLGDVGQDMLLYGSKLYVSVFGSSYVRVISADNLTSVKKIMLFNDGKPRGTRYLAAHRNFVYVSCWDSTVARIDTTSLTIDAQKATVGSYPEGLAVHGDKLYVANASYVAHIDSTVSVIDLNTFTETGKIVVGQNPNIVKSDGEKYVYLSYQGDFGMVAGGFQRINTQTGETSYLSDAPTSDYVLYDGKVYFYNTFYDPNNNWAATSTFGRFNVSGATAGTVEPIVDVAEAGKIISPFGIGVSTDAAQKIYIADAGDFKNPGKIIIFDATGKKITEKEAGIAPCKFIFK